MGLRSGSSAAGARNGRRVARLFRQYRGIGDAKACDLDAILAEDDIEVIESSCADPGYTACLLWGGNGAGGGIILAPGQDRGRRRFSLAHELGHYHIPSHREPLVQGICADRDLRARSTDANQREWEANDFAAELLMPSRLFAADARRLDVSIHAVHQLAAPEMYDVSILAAAWRLVQTSTERCAMVVSAHGKVEWIVRSESCWLPLTERQQHLHPDTLAAGVFRGEGAVARPYPVPMGVWLDHATHERGELLESTHIMPRLGQVVSLLWLIEHEEEESPV